MTELTGMTCDEITAWVKNQGYPSFRGKQIFRWISNGVESFSEMTNIPQQLREQLEKVLIKYGDKLLLRLFPSVFPELCF